MKVIVWKNNLSARLGTKVPNFWIQFLSEFFAKTLDLTNFPSLFKKYYFPFSVTFFELQLARKLLILNESIVDYYWFPQLIN